MLLCCWTRYGSTRIVAAIGVACLFATACTADTNITPAAQDRAASVVEDEGTSASDRGGEVEASEDFSVFALLQQVPLSATDDAGSSLQVSVADVDAAADQARLRRPVDRSDVDQLVEFVLPLTGGPAENRRLRVFVPFPQAWTSRAIIGTDEFVDELGFSVGDVTTFIALESPPAQFIVGGGISANPDLPEIAPGVSTAGEGNDLEIDPGSTTAARPLGRPLRIAERDGLVALSLATDPIVDWLDEPGGLTLADNRALAALATRLDEESVVSALLYAAEGSAGEGVGLGWAADTEPRGVIVFAYRSADEAQAQLPAVIDGFEGPSLGSAGSIADLVTLDKIEVQGSEIVATVGFPDEGNPRTIFVMLIQRDGPFAEAG